MVFQKGLPFFLLSYFLLLVPYSLTNYFSGRYLYSSGMFFAPLLFISLDYYSKQLFKNKNSSILKTIGVILLLCFSIQVISNQLFYRKMGIDEIEKPAGVAFKEIRIELKGEIGSKDLFHFIQGEKLYISEFIGINNEENRFYDALKDFPEKKPGFYMHRRGSYDVCWLLREGRIKLITTDVKENAIIHVFLRIINILDGEEFQRKLRVECDNHAVSESTILNTIEDIRMECNLTTIKSVNLHFSIQPVGDNN